MPSDIFRVLFLLDGLCILDYSPLETDRFEAEIDEHVMDIIPLPHPSGASTWHRTEPGISLLELALSLIKQHPAWQQIS